MAIYREDIIAVELESGSINRSFLNHSIGIGDRDANRFGVRVFRNGEAEDLTGVSCFGYFRNADGTNIALTNHGTVSGNMAFVTLPQACYAVEGQFTLAIKLIGGDVTGTMRIVDGMVDNTNTGSPVAPTSDIPSYTEILAVYDQMQEALESYDAIVEGQNAKLDSLPANVNTYQKYQGNLSDAGTWNNINANYQHFVFPVSGGEHLVITATGRTNVGFVQSYSAPVDGAAIDYSTAQGYTGKFQFAGAGTQEYDIPSDVRFVIIENLFAGTDNKLTAFRLNGYNYAENVVKNIFAYRGNMEDRGIAAFSDIADYGFYNFSATYAEQITDAPDRMSGGIVQYFPTFGASGRAFMIIDVSGNVWFKLGTNTPIHISMGLDRSLTYHGTAAAIGLTSFAQATEMGYYGFSADSLANITDKPTGLTRGGILQVWNYAATQQRIQIITDLDGTQWFRYGTNAFAKMGSSGARNVVWYAMGDSITQGYTGSGGNIGPVTTDNYVKNVALLNGYTFVNYGEGGAGYLHNATVGSQKNAKGKAGDIDFSGCDLVTLAYGVNDWHYSQAIGSVADSKDLGTTMCSNMKWVIEKILTDNPMCKIIVMTPMNCSKYGGDFSTNWGLGYSLETSGTLQNVIDAIISVCEYYGIEYIDQSKTSICNRFNINDCLGDGIHPAAAFYPKMAKDLAAKINMK